MLETARLPGESRLSRIRKGRQIVPGPFEPGQYVLKKLPERRPAVTRAGVSEGTQNTNSKDPSHHSCENRVNSAAISDGKGLTGGPAWYSGFALHDE